MCHQKDETGNQYAKWQAPPHSKADRYTTKDGKKVGFDNELAYEKIKHPRPEK